MENQTQQQIQFQHEFQLNSLQMRYLQTLLPEGIMLVQDKPQKPLPGHPQKKIFKQQQATSNDQDESKRPKRQKKQRQTYFEDFDSSPLVKQKYRQQQVNQFQENPSDEIKKCYKMMGLLRKHKYAGPFLEAVDPYALNIPDYFDIIKEPMDLATVDKNLKDNHYQNMLQFANDVRKIWHNAMLYNPQGSDIHVMAQEMQEYFEKTFKDVESDKNVHINELQRRVDRLTRELKDLHQAKGSKVNSKTSSRVNMDKPMSIQEKRSLGQNIRQLPPEHLRVVCEIVSEGQDIPQDEIEIDIDTLPPRKCRELERFVKSKLQIINKNKQVNQQTKKKTTPTWNTTNPPKEDLFYQQQQLPSTPAQQNNQPPLNNGSQQQLNQFSNYQSQQQQFLNTQQQRGQQQQKQNIPINSANQVQGLFQQEQIIPFDYQQQQAKTNQNDIQSDSSFITESDESENDI